MNLARRATPACAALVALIAACGPGKETPADSARRADSLSAARSDSIQRADSIANANFDQTKVATTYAPALHIDLARMKKLPDGLYIRDVVVGKGPRADTNSYLTIHYVGWLSDGKKIDSSRDRKKSLDIPIGSGNVLQGWDEGIPGMREGGRRIIVVPPSLGYGLAGQPGIVPSKATLVFEIELLKVRK